MVARYRSAAGGAIMLWYAIHHTGLTTLKASIGVTDLDFIGSVDIWGSHVGSLQAATDSWEGPGMLVAAQHPQQMLQRRSKLLCAHAGVRR